MQSKHYLFSVKWAFCLLMLLPLTLFSQAKIIWTDLAGNISKANADGTKIEKILGRQVPLDLETNLSEQKLYWSESGGNAIWRIGLSGSVPELVYKSTDKLQGITFDQNKLYFIQGTSILRMNTDGTQLETIVTAVSDARDVVVINGLVYWSTISNSKILKQNANGKGGVAILSDLASANNLIYHPREKKLYWREYCGASVCSGVRKANPDGSNKVNVIDAFVGGFSFSSDSSKLYCTYDIFDEIFSINTDGTGRVKLAGITSSPTGITLLGNKLCWLDLAYGDYLYTADLNGSNRKVLATTPVYQPTRFAIDTVDKWIYWVNQHSSFSDDRSSSTSIRKAKLDGSQQQVIIPSSTVKRPFGIGLDLKNKKLYWTDRENSGLYRSNLNGTSVEKIVSGASNPTDLALDVERGYLFWSDWGTQKVMRANLSGGQQKTLAQNLSTPIGLALDKTGGYLYFAERSTPRIKRVPIDSGKVDTVLVRPTVFDRVEGLWIDNSKGHLYWTDDGSGILYRAGLNGSNVTKLADKSSGLSSPAGIQVFNSSFIVPTKNPNKVGTLKIYPNPFSASFQVQGLKVGDELVLFDQLGRQSLQQKVTLDGTTSITCARLPAGMYYLTVRHKDGQISVEKLYKYTDE
jgi:sugar lactone lactonase YvrE